MVKIDLGNSIVTPEEGEQGEITLWLPNEFAKEVVRTALDRNVTSIYYNNIEDPKVGIIRIFDEEIDKVLECELKIKPVQVKDLMESD